MADQAELAAGLIAFDTWIFNDDRHPKNLAYRRGVQPLAVFDHSHALGSHGRRALLAQLPGREAEVVPGRHCLFTELTSAAHLGPWVAAIASVPQSTIERVVNETVSAGALTADEAAIVMDFLRNRQMNLGAVLRATRPDLPDWGLPL